MKLVALFLVCAPALAAADVSVIDNNKAITVDCTKDPVVDLIGNHITLTLTGTCKKVNVTGNHETVTGSATTVFVAGNENTLTIDASDSITVAGNRNTVTWKTGSPKISNPGKNNKVTQAK